MDDLAVLIEWAQAGEDVAQDFEKALEALESEVEAGEIKKMLSGEHDAANAIVTIHPGAGGTESQDWAEMLLRMYLKWAERRGFKRSILDYQPGEEAGLKSVTFTLTGEYAFGLMAAEAGVHRLVRISPFDQAARRHTSFASVYVWPEMDEDIEIDAVSRDAVEGHGVAADDKIVDAVSIEGRPELPERLGRRPPVRHAHWSGEATTDGSQVNVRLSVYGPSP